MAGGERYYHTDTHWNERGAKAAADAIAVALRKAGLAPTQKAEFRVTTDKALERVGDLIRLAGLDRVPYPLRPRGDIMAATVIEQSAAPDMELLDDTAAPELVVLGTSFSRYTHFVPFLSLALMAPVDNESRCGAAAWIGRGHRVFRANRNFKRPHRARSSGNFPSGKLKSRCLPPMPNGPAACPPLRPGLTLPRQIKFKYDEIFMQMARLATPYKRTGSTAEKHPRFKPISLRAVISPPHLNGPTDRCLRYTTWQPVAKNL